MRWHIQDSITAAIIVIGGMTQLMAVNPAKQGHTSSFRYGYREIGLFHDHVTHDVAGVKCRLWGGELVKINSRSLQKAIERHIREMNVYHPSEWGDDLFGAGFYIAAHDRIEEGVFRWQDSSLVSSQDFQNWGPSEPNNYGVALNSVGEDCAMILLKDVFPRYGFTIGTWMDVDCSLRKFYICERETSQLLLSDGEYLGVLDRLLSLREKCTNDVINGFVDIPLRSHRACGDDNISYVIGWDTNPQNYKWNAKFTGNHIEMTTVPRRSLRSLVEGAKLFVDKMIIKWESGSQRGSRHSFGGSRKSAEIQIIHEDHSTLGKIGFSFFIQERNNPGNRVWEGVLRAITKNRNLGAKSLISDPPSLESLLSDSNDIRFRHPRHILNRPIRYEIESDQRCGKITWFVFQRMIRFSTAQLNFLRAMRGQGSNVESQHLQPKNICKL